MKKYMVAYLMIIFQKHQCTQMSNFFEDIECINIYSFILLKFLVNMMSIFSLELMQLVDQVFHSFKNEMQLFIRLHMENLLIYR